MSRPAALELPSRVSKSHPVSREIRSVCLPSSSHARFVPRSRSQPDLFVRLNLVHEELFSTLPQQRSLLLIHRLQVALDFAVVWSRIACCSGSRSACTSLIFLVSCGFVSCPENGMLSALHTSLSSVLFFSLKPARTFGLSFISDVATFSSSSCKMLFFSRSVYATFAAQLFQSFHHFVSRPVSESHGCHPQKYLCQIS